MPPFSVYRLAEPQLEPAFVGDARKVDGRRAAYTLMFGDVAASDGPFASILSHATGEWRSLEAMIDNERARLFDHAEIDEKPSTDIQGTSAFITVNGRQLEFAVRREGILWAARSDVGEDDREVTVVARGIELGTGVRLELVDDLGPFWESRDRVVAEVTTEYEKQQAAQPNTEQATGAGALWELVEQQIQFNEALRNQVKPDRLKKGFTPRVPRSLHPREGLWSDATEALAELRRLDQITANQEVTSMVNHLTTLAAEADWFDQETLRTKAIEETIRFHAERAEVASITAQQAWTDLWDTRQQPGKLRTELQRAWYEAWQSWSETR